METLLATISVILLSALTGYIALLILAEVRTAVRASGRAELERSVLRKRIEQLMDQRRATLEQHERSWNGFRKFRVARKVQETHDTCSFYLSPHDGQRLSPFQPGQYLTFQLNIPGKSALAPAKPVVRCYSLSDSANHPDTYRVTIKRTPPPRGKPELPPGIASTFFHDQVREGDILDVKAPSGQFTLDLAQQTPIVLIAGGVGLTPLLSMLLSIVEGGSRREVWIFYGVRNRAEHIMREPLGRLALEHENVHLHVCYSDPTEEDIEGRDYQHGERVTAALLKRLLPSSNYAFYICGPPPMMDQMTQDLAAWGVPKRSIHFEAFGPATVKKLTPTDAPAASAKPTTGFEVTFAKSGKTCHWTPNGQSLLECAEAIGVTIDSGCRAGNCGTCLTAIKSGGVDYLVEHGAEPEEGSCLTCISVPKTDLILDA